MNNIKELLQYLAGLVKIWVIVQPWEAGIRVRCGKKIKNLSKGIHFRLPYFDSVYIQEIRYRVSNIPIQTISISKDKALTIDASFGYEIVDINLLYNTLYKPERTMINILMGIIAEIHYNNDHYEHNIQNVKAKIFEKADFLKYGIELKSFEIKSYAIIRTLRIIKDESWYSSDIEIDTKK